jgi:hypothetical protein
MTDDLRVVVGKAPGIRHLVCVVGLLAVSVGDEEYALGGRGGDMPDAVYVSQS